MIFQATATAQKPEVPHFIHVTHTHRTDRQGKMTGLGSEQANRGGFHQLTDFFNSRAMSKVGLILIRFIVHIKADHSAPNPFRKFGYTLGNVDLIRLATPRKTTHFGIFVIPCNPQPPLQLMKRLLLALCFVVLVNPLLRAADLTNEELQRAVKYLQSTREGVIDATKGLSEAQWNFKPTPERWSVAEVTEHIAAAEDMLMGLIQGQVMTAPANTEAGDAKSVDELVLQAIPDRSHKLKAPEPLIPVNRFHTPTDSLSHFKESRDKTIGFVKETKGLRDHAIDSPLGKKLDAYQWILFIAAHSDRHTKQILEVKADPNFPKK